MTKYAAIINIPGYMPNSDDVPATFDTAQEAWAYLSDERLWQEDVADMRIADSEWAYRGKPYSNTAKELDHLAATSDGEGTVSGDTPGHEGDHDLGIAYSVQIVE